MKLRAGSRPPTSSMTMWTSGSPRTRAASFVSGSVSRSSPSRGRVRSVSATAARVSRQPARSSSVARCDWRILTTPAPTVPRPRSPMRTSPTDPLLMGWPRVGGSAVQVLEAAERLLDPLLVLDEGKADVPLAVFAEANARRDRHLRLLDEELRELERAEAAERVGNGRPHEHGALGLVDPPAQLVEAVDEDVAPLAVHLDDLVDDFLVAFERDDARDLDGLEGTIVEIRLDAGERVDHAGVAAHEAEAPAGHVVRLRRGEDLDADLLGARDLEERRRLVAVEGEVGVGEVVHDHEPVLAGEVDDLHEEVTVHAHGGGVVREGENQELRLRPCELRRLLQPAKEVAVGRERDRSQIAVGDDHRIRVYRVRRVRHQRAVARLEHRQREMRHAFLGADGGDDFGIGVEVDRVTLAIPGGHGLAEPRDAA